MLCFVCIPHPATIFYYLNLLKDFFKSFDHRMINIWNLCLCNLAWPDISVSYMLCDMFVDDKERDLDTCSTAPLGPLYSLCANLIKASIIQQLPITNLPSAHF